MKPKSSTADRGDIAEEIVAGILAPLGWEYCGGAWAGWDFEHRDGTRMQLKQAAALQTWKAPKEIRPTRFGIKLQTGYWANGADWTPAPAPTRYAAIYIFAWHDVTDKKTCDHADPAQWRFYVVPTTELPDTNTLTLATLQRRPAHDVDTLAAAVEFARCGVKRRPATAPG